MIAQQVLPTPARGILDARILGREPHAPAAIQGRVASMQVQEALAAGGPFALAFLDYRMPPGWNGVETLRHLWKVAPSLRVVLCSAHADYSWEEISQEFGNSRLLTELRKPFHGEELIRLAITLTASLP